MHCCRYLRESHVEFDAPGDEDSLQQHVQWFRATIGDARSRSACPSLTCWCLVFFVLFVRRGGFTYLFLSEEEGARADAHASEKSAEPDKFWRFFECAMNDLVHKDE